jgi:glycine/D-amino acid oxidase-like deaminating enzyme/nitrite reductase/ring-hydroxylating ferredoxin subunit
MDTLWRAKSVSHNSGKEKGESIWVQNEYRNAAPSFTLKSDINTEVAVIGAGLAGILTAYLLQERGIDVVVIEKDQVGSGATRNTTAKITSQHGLIYQKLLRYKGEERAKEYARANQMAIQKYEEISNHLHIDCDYEILPNYIYSLKGEEKIRKEAEAAKKIGLPAVYVKETTLPFQVKAAVRFEKQAQFHPMKFMDGVAKELTIYEHTNIIEIKKNGLIITEQGNIKAKSIVIATHYPFINTPGYYFLRLHQERSYVTALQGWKKEDNILDGMYLDEDKNGFSFRTYSDYLILGSGYHRTGDNNPLNAYEKIEMAAKKWYPEATIGYRWSNQDCITPDGIPYIGRYSARTPNLYIATGFNKWGMTSSMAAAQIISDMIVNKESEYEKVFYPRRLMFSGSKVLLKDTGIIAKSQLSERLKMHQDKLEDIQPNQAGTINYNGEKYGVYRDKENRYYFVTTKCPHLGCSLEWNQNELTWDCPCHGSRFDYHGRLISNPATRDAFDTCQRKLIKK